MRRIAATISLTALFVGALALAVTVLTADSAEAQMCFPETQTRLRKVSEGACCSSDPPGRTWYYFKEERHRNPNCTWTHWIYVERVSKCILDATCDWVPA